METSNLFHKYSRAPLADGQLHISQAMLRSGHNVSWSDVRAQDIPPCQAQDALVDQNGNVVQRWRAVLKFWHRAQLTQIFGSNGQSWWLISQTDPVNGFIDPADKLVESRVLSLGYAPIIYGSKPGSDQLQKISSNHWMFEAFSGVLSFNSGQTPRDLGYDKIYIEAFSYIGKTVKDVLEDLQARVSQLEH